LLIILAAAVPKSTVSESVLTFLLPDKDASRIFLSPMGFFATVLMVMGAIIRIQCFRELGKHFTFQVTILKDHKLITSGPYSYVRHPGYTGAYLCLAGLAIWYTAQGSWLRESGVYKIPLAWPLLGPVMVHLFLAGLTLFRRISKEDEMMMKTFGKEWDEWARKVPDRILPGIY
jgi:protein-S-isoprenylcysteine O-methyltransferase Ste14